MVEMNLALCYGKTHKLKICTNCKVLNWYENTECIGEDCDCRDFNDSKEAVLNYLDQDYEYYQENEYMSEA